MKKSILVVTHERCGTHLLINTINYKNNGNFTAIGKLPSNKPHNLETYKDYVYKYTLMNVHDKDIVSKSHHQIEFFEDKDFLFSNYKVIYLKREVKDTLCSYHRFLNCDENYEPIKDFPLLEDWVFMNPKETGFKYFAGYPDPHVIIEPIDYIDRILIHQKGWEEYKDNILTISYEDVVSNYYTTKNIIEEYIEEEISPHIPDINNKDLPNFFPNKGVVGSHKDLMSKDLIIKINEIINKRKNND